MPKQGDPLGIQLEGPVLQGEKSVEQGRREDAIAANRVALSCKQVCYRRIGDYDPVLRSHCRL
jgi:hypothetical protein